MEPFSSWVISELGRKLLFICFVGDVSRGIHIYIYVYAVARQRPINWEPNNKMQHRNELDRCDHELDNRLNFFTSFTMQSIYILSPCYIQCLNISLVAVRLFCVYIFWFTNDIYHAVWVHFFLIIHSQLPLDCILARCTFYCQSIYLLIIFVFSHVYSFFIFIVFFASKYPQRQRIPLFTWDKIEKGPNINLNFDWQI